MRQEGKVADVALDGESGFVTGVTLDDRREFTGDLFIDCSGFRGLLIEQALHTGYGDWSQYLPCDRAVALPCLREDGSPPPPFTRATAHSAGWQWQVPLQHRNGNGHVYCSSYMEDQAALDILLGNIAGKPQADLNWLRFTTGRRKEFWNKNVAALRLAAGLMEPLESTSIHLINTGIDKLISLLSLDGVTQVQEDTFNRLTAREYVGIRDFLVLHYNATERTDSDFWNYVRTMDVPDTLTEKVEIFKANGQIFARGGRAVHRDELGGGDNGPGHPHGRAQRNGRCARPGKDPRRGRRDGEVDPLPRAANAGPRRLSRALLPRADRGLRRDARFLTNKACA